MAHCTNEHRGPRGSRRNSGNVHVSTFWSRLSVSSRPYRPYKGLFPAGGSGIAETRGLDPQRLSAPHSLAKRLPPTRDLASIGRVVRGWDRTTSPRGDTLPRQPPRAIPGSANNSAERGGVEPLTRRCPGFRSRWATTSPSRSVADGDRIELLALARARGGSKPVALHERRRPWRSKAVTIRWPLRAPSLSRRRPLPEDSLLQMSDLAPLPRREGRWQKAK